VVCCLVLWGCNFFSKDCTFGDTVQFKAKVQDIVPYTEKGKKFYHVMMKFDNEEVFKDMVCLEDLINHKIDSEYIEKFKVVYGVTYTGSLTPLKQGGIQCPRYIVAFDQKLTP